MEQVFISYSRRDYLDDNNQVIPGNIVSRIKEALTKEGISYWFDEEGITHGDAFASVIVKHIRDCQVFLFISSENSNKSVWTAREIATASRFEKKIIPFRCDRAPYNDEVMLYLSTLDFIEGYKDPDTAIQRLVKAIGKHLDEINREKQRKQKELEEKRRKEQEEREKAEKLESLSTRINALGQKRSELEGKLDAARKSVAQFDAELTGVDEEIEGLKKERERLQGNGQELSSPPKENVTPSKPNPAINNRVFPTSMEEWALRRLNERIRKKKEARGNVFTRGLEDIKSQWKRNPILVNIFAVLALCALAYLLFYLYGTTLKSYSSSIKTVAAKRGFSYEYAVMVGTVLVSAWGLVKLLRKDAIGYFYIIVPQFILVIAGLLGKTSKQFGPYYDKLGLVCGIIGLLSIAILALRKGKTPFWSMLHLRFKETFKDWRYLAVWGSAIILLALFGLTLLHFHGVWL